MRTGNETIFYNLRNLSEETAFYNIGCILFSRERWLMMGKWPERAGESGMGTDEGTIYQDNVEKDLPIYILNKKCDKSD